MDYNTWTIEPVDWYLPNRPRTFAFQKNSKQFLLNCIARFKTLDCEEYWSKKEEPNLTYIKNKVKEKFNANLVFDYKVNLLYLKYDDKLVSIEKNGEFIKYFMDIVRDTLCNHDYTGYEQFKTDCWKVVSSISYEPIEEPKSINYHKPEMSMLQKLMIQQLTKK